MRSSSPNLMNPNHPSMKPGVDYYPYANFVAEEDDLWAIDLVAELKRLARLGEPFVLDGAALGSLSSRDNALGQLRGRVIFALLAARRLGVRTTQELPSEAGWARAPGGPAPDTTTDPYHGKNPNTA